jgi:hypothetical protein
MAYVLLTSSAPSDSPGRPYPYDELDRMKRSASEDKFGAHQLTDDPEQANIILFVENCDTIRHYLEVRRHPYLRTYREKCFLHSKYDHPLPFLPGVYPSIEEGWYAKQRTRSGGYLKAFGHDFIEYEPSPVERNYLYSFSGSAVTHPVREKLFALEHEDQYLLDTSPFWPYAELDKTEKKQLEQQYVDVTRSSKFVLCPRGQGASSIRLFESMKMARAPVIIADEWVPPRGPNWNAFSLRVAEDNISRIPRILEEHEDCAVEMGHRARAAWEDWFAVEAFFHRTVEWCLNIKETRRRKEAWLRYSVLPQLLRPLHLKALVRKALPDSLKEPLSRLA